MLSVSDLLTVSIIKRVVFGKNFSSNEAEYKTLIYALEYIIKEYNAANIELHIAGDSELVRNQVGYYNVLSYQPRKIVWVDMWQTRKQHLQPYRNKARELLKQFKSFTYVHVPRKEIVAILGH